VWHHVDLDAGYGFADTRDELVHLFLVDTVARLASSDGAPGLAIRTDQGDEWTIGDGSTTIVGSRWGVLHWLARGRTDGLEEPAAPLPALPFGG